MKQQIERLRAQVEAAYDQVVETRRYIHMHPELSGEERGTMAYISDYLTGLGIPHETGVGGCGIVALIGDPNAAFAVGHHWGTFQLTNEPIEQFAGGPIARRVVYTTSGRTFTFGVSAEF